MGESGEWLGRKWSTCELGGERLRWVLVIGHGLEHVDGVVGFAEYGRERMRKLVAVKGEALVGTGMASLVAWKLD